MLEVSDFQQRKQIQDQLQQLVYEEVPIVKLGDFFGLTIKRRKLNGENNPVSQYPIFWNRWLDK
jgi:hypothetical protein